MMKINSLNDMIEDCKKFQNTSREFYENRHWSGSLISQQSINDRWIDRTNTAARLSLKSRELLFDIIEAKNNPNFRISIDEEYAMRTCLLLINFIINNSQIGDYDIRYMLENWQTGGINQIFEDYPNFKVIVDNHYQ